MLGWVQHWSIVTIVYTNLYKEILKYYYIQDSWGFQDGVHCTTCREDLGTTINITLVHTTVSIE